MMTPERISERWKEMLQENQQHEALASLYGLTIEQYMEREGLSPFLFKDDPELIAKLRAQLRKEVLESRESVFIEDNIEALSEITPHPPFEVEVIPKAEVINTQ